MLLMECCCVEYDLVECYSLSIYLLGEHVTDLKFRKSWWKARWTRVQFSFTNFYEFMSVLIFTGRIQIGEWMCLAHLLRRFCCQWILRRSIVERQTKVSCYL